MNFLWFFSTCVFVIVNRVSKEILKISLTRRTEILILADFFWSLMYVLWNTKRKMGVSVILKVQPIQYDTYIVFVIWKLLKLHTGPGNMEIWKTMQFRHNKAQKIKKKKLLGHFRLSEGYAYPRTPIVK